MRGARSIAGLAIVLSTSSVAHALDLPKVAGKPIRLDITETSIGLQRFDARQGLNPKEYGWGGWLNKLNAQLGWGKWTVGARIDSSLYWLRPVTRSFCAEGCRFTPEELPSVQSDDASRYRNNVYLAKAWLTYKAPGVEATVGDAYAQFGRGLVLSMRKVDELGVDTTVRGAKIAIQKDPVAITLLAGFANPARVDEATGAALFRSRPLSQENPNSTTPLYGSDRVVGAELQAGRGTPIIASTRMALFSRCAPYAYKADGSLDLGVTSSAFGSCAAEDREAWLGTMSRGLNPLLRAKEIMQVGQSFEIPNLWGHGNLYVEGAIQDRKMVELEPNPDLRQGNALYGSFVTDFGPVTATLEGKSYRNYYSVPAAIDATRALPFSAVQYSNQPTTELLIQDSMFGFFNACVDGGRLRTDVRLMDGFLVYGTGAYYRSKSEIVGGSCDRYGRTISSATPNGTHTFIWDGQAGVEWRFDRNRSQVLFAFGTRDDRFGNGNPYYNERSLNYSISIFLKGPYSFELYGRHRIRFQHEENVRGTDDDPRVVPWGQGFHTTAFKIAPKWVIGQGIEYYTLLGQPATYLNGQLLYRFTSESNVKLLVGQQQGGLRCISGVCRVFPAFEGVRAEVTLRF